MCLNKKFVSSSSESAFGFLSADGLVDERLFVDELDSKNSPPHAFESCVFQFQGSADVFWLSFQSRILILIEQHP
jgi:hypothetical protein